VLKKGLEYFESLMLGQAQQNGKSLTISNPLAMSKDSERGFSVAC
jgi:hypothetical protein